MLYPCSSSGTYVTIMLKEDITIENIGIINREYYSSNVKDIEVEKIWLYL